MFNVRRYEPYRTDREGRHKGGILILLKNNIAADEIRVDTARPPGSDNTQSDVIGVSLPINGTEIEILGLQRKQ